MTREIERREEEGRGKREEGREGRGKRRNEKPRRSREEAESKLRVWIGVLQPGDDAAYCSRMKRIKHRLDGDEGREEAERREEAEKKGSREEL